MGCGNSKVRAVAPGEDPLVLEDPILKLESVPLSELEVVTDGLKNVDSLWVCREGAFLDAFPSRTLNRNPCFESLEDAQMMCMRLPFAGGVTQVGENTWEVRFGSHMRADKMHIAHKDLNFPVHYVKQEDSFRMKSWVCALKGVPRPEENEKRLLVKHTRTESEGAFSAGEGNSLRKKRGKAIAKRAEAEDTGRARNARRDGSKESAPSEASSSGLVRSSSKLLLPSLSSDASSLIGKVLGISSSPAATSPVNSQGPSMLDPDGGAGEDITPRGGLTEYLPGGPVVGDGGVETPFLPKTSAPHHQHRSSSEGDPPHHVVHPATPALSSDGSHPVVTFNVPRDANTVSSNHNLASAGLPDQHHVHHFGITRQHSKSEETVSGTASAADSMDEGHHEEADGDTLQADFDFNMQRESHILAARVARLEQEQVSRIPSQQLFIESVDQFIQGSYTLVDGVTHHDLPVWKREITNPSHPKRKGGKQSTFLAHTGDCWALSKTTTPDSAGLESAIVTCGPSVGPFSPLIYNDWEDRCGIVVTDLRSYDYHPVAVGRSSTQLFTDPEFPPVTRSLGSDAKRWAKYEPVWIRGSQLFRGRSAVLYDRVDPSLFSFVSCLPGALSSQWVLSALASLAEYPTWIESHILCDEEDPPQQHSTNDQLHNAASTGTTGDALVVHSSRSAGGNNKSGRLKQTKADVRHSGKYTFNLYDVAMREWTKVTVDDFLPCDGRKWSPCYAKPLFARPVRNQILACLLEKAIAKLYGSYAALEGGQTGFAWMALTGVDRVERWTLQQVPGSIDVSSNGAGTTTGSTASDVSSATPRSSEGGAAAGQVQYTEQRQQVTSKRRSVSPYGTSKNGASASGGGTGSGNGNGSGSESPPASLGKNLSAASAMSELSTGSTGTSGGRSGLDSPGRRDRLFPPLPLVDAERLASLATPVFEGSRQVYMQRLDASKKLEALWTHLRECDMRHYVMSGSIPGHHKFGSATRGLLPGFSYTVLRTFELPIEDAFWSSGSTMRPHAVNGRRGDFTPHSQEGRVPVCEDSPPSMPNSPGNSRTQLVPSGISRAIAFPPSIVANDSKRSAISLEERSTGGGSQRSNGDRSPDVRTPAGDRDALPFAGSAPNGANTPAGAPGGVSMNFSSMVSGQSTKKTLRLLQMRSRFREFPWRGRWANDDKANWDRLSMATKVLANLDEPAPFEQCGSFYVQWEEFVNVFKFVGVCPKPGLGLKRPGAAADSISDLIKEARASRLSTDGAATSWDRGRRIDAPESGRTSSVGNRTPSHADLSQDIATVKKNASLPNSKNTSLSQEQVELLAGKINMIQDKKNNEPAEQVPQVPHANSLPLSHHDSQTTDPGSHGTFASSAAADTTGEDI
ncbi:unnamed protein product [Amoebophrya sp. A25]|nr:unnamed protein product [Amoebophrya sp. A25]|eukprot:GSA25T00001207001.1